MSKRLFRGVCVLGVCVIWGLGISGEPQGRQLSVPETDQAINAVFAGAQGVVRMEADLITQKSGGMVKGEQTTYEFLRMEAPSRMWLQNRGASQGQLPLEQSSLIIVDGRNIFQPADVRALGFTYHSVGRD